MRAVRCPSLSQRQPCTIPKVVAGSGQGVVFVIEDLSELLAAQRAAAWSEVARRMAHEIKNPLTPIQLSAERIAKSFHRNGAGENSNGSPQNGSGATPGETESAGSRDASRIATVIDECTETITREVAGLKAMVDEFSRFARLPLARLEPARSESDRTQCCGAVRGSAQWSRVKD